MFNAACVCGFTAQQFALGRGGLAGPGAARAAATSSARRCAVASGSPSHGHIAIAPGAVSAPAPHRSTAGAGPLFAGGQHHANLVIWQRPLARLRQRNGQLILVRRSAQTVKDVAISGVRGLQAIILKQQRFRGIRCRARPSRPALANSARRATPSSLARSSSPSDIGISAPARTNSGTRSSGASTVMVWPPG